jgi:hypothetical protein
MDRNDESLSTRDLLPSRDAQTGAGGGSQSAEATDSQTDSPRTTSPPPEQEPTRPLDDPDQALISTPGPGHEPRGSLPEEHPENLTAGAETGATRDARPGSAPDGDSGPLLPMDSTADFQSRWKAIQTRFVDDPRGAVEDADGLVAIIMQALAESFAQERDRLEGQWDRGEDISTEDLRVALQRYRSFFHRLLST